MSKKSKKEAPHFAGGKALKGHGAHDVENPIVVNQSAGYHSGRMAPKPTPLGGDQLPSGDNGGLVGAGDVAVPSIDPGEQNLPKHLRGGASIAYASGATPTPAAAQN